MDVNRYKAARSVPSQARGKERVRVILSATLELLQESSIEQITTNDIAERAGIPIGSLYRYYPNKDAIIMALTELYVGDISRIFAEIGNHPLLRYLSWEEVLLLMVDGWVAYARLNGALAFLNAAKANPRVYRQNQDTWALFYQNFKAVIMKRCPELSVKEAFLCFKFCITAAEMGITDDYNQIMGDHPHHQAVSAIASHMLGVCRRHPHSQQALA